VDSVAKVQVIPTVRVVLVQVMRVDHRPATLVVLELALVYHHHHHRRVHQDQLAVWVLVSADHQADTCFLLLHPAMLTNREFAHRCFCHLGLWLHQMHRAVEHMPVELAAVAYLLRVFHHHVQVQAAFPDHRGC
jgi:hypothetical protein